MRACSYCFPVGRLVVHYQNWPSCMPDSDNRSVSVTKSSPVQLWPFEERRVGGRRGQYHEDGGVMSRESIIMDKYDDTAFHPLSCLRGPLSVTEEYRGGLKRMAPGWVNFVANVANHFCLHLPEKFPQPWGHFLAQPCTANTANSPSPRRMRRGRWGRED